MDFSLEKMEKACKAVANIVDELYAAIKNMKDSEEIHNFCQSKMEEISMIPAALNYKGFKKPVCVSINNVVCHGMIFQEIPKNAIVSVDIAGILDGHFGDTCFSYIIGAIEQRKKLLVETTHESMWQAIESIRPGVTTGYLGSVMESVAEKKGFSTVRDFCGHGVGTKFHEEPQIPFYKASWARDIIKSNKCITIEPMLNEGNYKIKIMEDGWTAITADGKWSAQFEHSIFVGENFLRVLTFNNFDKSMGKKDQIFFK